MAEVDEFTVRLVRTAAEVLNGTPYSDEEWADEMLAWDSDADDSAAVCLAVARVALERAAEVADEYVGCDTPMGAYEACAGVAAAIRALIPAEETT